MLPLTRRLRRRIGKLVVTISPEGVSLRGYRCRARAKTVTWSQIASLADRSELLAASEQHAGEEELERLKADLKAAIGGGTQPPTDYSKPVVTPEPTEAAAKRRDQHITRQPTLF